MARKIWHTKKKGQPQINSFHTSNLEKRCMFYDSFKDSTAYLSWESHDPVTCWKTLHNSIYKSAVKAFGLHVNKNADWFNANWDVMEPAVEASHKAHLAYKNATNHEVLTAPRTDRAVSGAPNPFMKELNVLPKNLAKP